MIGEKEMHGSKVYKIGNITDLDGIPIANTNALAAISRSASILSEEYGINRNTDTDDGGYILYAMPNATCEDIKAYFDYTRHTVEYVDKLGDICSALYLLSNDYGIVIVMLIADAPPEILEEMDV
jgi:hypothetical protein